MNLSYLFVAIIVYSTLHFIGSSLIKRALPSQNFLARKFSHPASARSSLSTSLISTSEEASMPAPAFFLPHGGGPMPLLGDPSHAELIAFMKKSTTLFKKPDAILVISAHWEESRPTLSLPTKKLLYDYYGFPPESYEITYNPPPLPDALVQKIRALLPSLAPQVDTERGLDHGAFVPLKLMYPDEDVALGVLSLVKGLDPEQHIEIGRALAPLLNDNVLILGSGLSYHNMRTFFAPPSVQQTSAKWSEAFHAELKKAVLAKDLARLAQWTSFPHARENHPREEHLAPIFVCAGAAAGAERNPKIVFDAPLLGHETIGVLWQ